jgi:hypothetical protein
MRVLLTNNTLSERAGTELYVRDVALELLRRGHRPVAYSTVLGPVADELRAATVPVVSRLESLGEPPDVIHGQHHYDALLAMTWFPETPAVYFCHGWLPFEEAPLRFPRVFGYVAVDELCRERLIVEGGVAPGDIEVILNFFDATRFPARGALPAVPRRALAFGNLFAEALDLPVLRDACARCGLELDVLGSASGRSTPRPEDLLPAYDVVFAKARSAIEAMATGAAVILTAGARLGPMITPDNFDTLRPLNFGARTLSRPLTPDALEAEIRRYDAASAAAVSRIVRDRCELRPAVDRIVGAYERAILKARSGPWPERLACERAVARYLEQHAHEYKRTEIAADRLRWIERCLTAERSLADADRALRAGEATRPIR